MNKDVIVQFDKFIRSEEDTCLVVGTNYQNKHLEVIRYLISLDKRLRILIRIPAMKYSEIILGYKSKAGFARKIKNLSIYIGIYRK